MSAAKPFELLLSPRTPSHVPTLAEMWANPYRLRLILASANSYEARRLRAHRIAAEVRHRRGWNVKRIEQGTPSHR